MLSASTAFLIFSDYLITNSKLFQAENATISLKKQEKKYFFLKNTLF
jgi:hypothetical protein